MQETSSIVTLIIATILIIGFLITAIFGVLMLYQQKQLANKNALEALALSYQQRILSSQIEVQEQTFQHISKEIHDNISLSLTLAKLNLNTIDWSESHTARSSVASSVDLMTVVIGELRDLSKSLNNEIIRDLGLAKALQNEAEMISRMSNLDVNYTLNGDPVYLSADKELVLFRIVQEACNNVIKHSQARKLDIAVSYNEHTLVLEVIDDGKGFDYEAKKAPGNSAGLRNMESRAKLFNGNVQVLSFPDQGTRVLINIPIHQNEFYS